MIKKIPIQNLKIGMYIHDLNCNWLDHSFASNQFKVNSSNQIEDIKKIAITHLYIDTDKGLDDTQASKPKMAPKRVPLREAMARAINIKEETSQAIHDVMDDVRLGRNLKVDKLNPIIDNMVESVTGNPDALLGLTRIRQADKYTYQHSVSVSILLSAFGEHMGMPREEIVQLGMGGLLHDIGKSKLATDIAIPTRLLEKKSLSLAKKHIEYSVQILNEVPDISDIVKNIAIEHHERYNGTGYPQSKSGEDISIYGQMAAIVDHYDSITSDSEMTKGIPPNEAMKQLIALSKRSGAFNPELVQLFIHCMGIYPVGSLVSLSNGKFAVVIESNSGELLAPNIRVIFNSLTRAFIEPEDIDLSSAQASSAKIVGAVDPDKWNIDPLEYIDIKQPTPE